MDKNLYTIVSNKVLVDGGTINWLYREEPDKLSDSGWRMFHGDETEEYMDNEKNFTICSIDYILKRHNYIESVLDMRIGISLERIGRGDFVESTLDNTNN